MTAEQCVQSSSEAGARLKELLLQTPQIANKYALKSAMRTEIFHCLNQIGMLGKNAIRQITELRCEVDEMASQAAGWEQERQALMDAGRAKDREIVELHETIRAMQAQAAARIANVGDLVDIFGTPNIMEGEGTETWVPQGGQNTSTAPLNTGASTHPPVGRDVAISASSSLGCQDVGGAGALPMCLDPEQSSLQLAEQIRDHNNARLQNSYLPCSESCLLPLWEHTTSSPMLQCPSTGGTSVSMFPSAVKEAWQLSEEAVESLMSRLRIPDVEDWNDWGADRRRQAVLEFCGIGSAAMYNLWEI